MPHFDPTIGIIVQKFVNKKEFTSPNHSHPYYEFLYIRQASFNYLIGEEIVTPADNSIILVNKNTIHKAVYANSDKNNYTIIKFYETLIHNDFQKDLNALFENRLLPFSNNDAILIDFLISKIYQEHRQQNHNREAMLRYQLNELIEHFYRLSLKANALPVKSVPTVTEQAITYINSNLTTEDHSLLSLQNISERFHMSSCAFSRMFKKEAGIGFKEYVLSAKILHAKELLASTDLPITEVAFLSGFSDSNYFSSVFKKYELMTPTDYAKFIKTLH